MATEEAKRSNLVAQGARAYRFGIERGHCPLPEPSAVALWKEGWDKAKTSFEAQFPPRRF
jgi:hypothetical protein